MTDTMSARERIRAVLEEAYYEGIYSEHNGGPEHVFDESWVGTIIDIVRETLLSETSVRWAASSMANRLADMVESGEAEVALGEAITAEALLDLGEAALQQPIDAAFGNEAGDE